MAQISAADFTGYDADIIMEIYVAEKIMLISASSPYSFRSHITI